MVSTRKRGPSFLVPPEKEHILTDMERLATSNGRTLTEEMLHAFERHLKQPPKVYLVVEEEELKPTKLPIGQHAPTGQLKKRGRPRKPKGGES